MDVGDFTASHFSACLHQRFLVHLEGRKPLPTELVEVRDLVPADDDPDRRPPFSVVFRGPPEATLAQSIFRVENETLGTFDLFLVTIGPDKDGRLRHEAVFT